MKPPQFPPVIIQLVQIFTVFATGLGCLVLMGCLFGVFLTRTEQQFDAVWQTVKWSFDLILATCPIHVLLDISKSLRAKRINSESGSLIETLTYE